MNPQSIVLQGHPCSRGVGPRRLAQCLCPGQKTDSALVLRNAIKSGMAVCGERANLSMRYRESARPANDLPRLNGAIRGTTRSLDPVPAGGPFKVRAARRWCAHRGCHRSEPSRMRFAADPIVRPASCNSLLASLQQTEKRRAATSSRPPGPTGGGRRVPNVSMFRRYVRFVKAANSIFHVEPGNSWPRRRTESHSAT